MKINGEKYADESQLNAELAKLQSGVIDEIQLVRSVKENTYMRLVGNANGGYDFCFVKGEDANAITLSKGEFDKIAGALLSYCNKDGKYKKMFSWQKVSADASVGGQPPRQESPAPKPQSADLWIQEPAKTLSPFECFTNTLTKNYCNFSGRASRRTFWYYTLFVSLLILILFGGAVITGASAEALIMLYLITCFALFLPGLSITVRRLHDTNRSGWFFLMSFIPYVGWIIMLVFEVLEGTPGENRYGAPEP